MVGSEHPVLIRAGWEKEVGKAPLSSNLQSGENGKWRGGG